MADLTPTAQPTQTESAPATPSPSPPPTLTATSTATPTPTPSPFAPTPTPQPGANLIAFETYRDGNAEIYLLDAQSHTLTNLTRHPAEDRAPAWRPDGQAIAFESNRSGNWDIYVLDLVEGSLIRVTKDPAYDGGPAWSPSGPAVWTIAFESYRDGNLEVYTVPSEGGQATRITDNPAGDYGPAWSPDGLSLAFTSWRDGNKEVYLIPAEGGEARNITQHSGDDEDPAWAPDGSALVFTSWRVQDARSGNRNAELFEATLEAGGTAQVERLTHNPWPDLDPAWDASGRLIWAAYDPGAEFETYDPFRPGDLHLYRAGPAGPAGTADAERLTNSGWDDRRPAPAPAQVMALAGLAGRLPSAPPESTASPTWTPGALAAVVEVPSVLTSYAEQPVRVSERVAPSLAAWQDSILRASGWDFLGKTLGAWRSIDQVRKREMYAYDYGYLSWHKTGRAIDLALEFKVNSADQMILTREDLGDNVYWRIYLRTAKQDGSLGEPMRDFPWLYWWHIVPEAEPDAYDAGGKRLRVPDGYYVDVTALAKRHGWERIAAYAVEGDYHWNTDSNGTEYWHYERTDGLQWRDAMLQLYPQEMIEQYAAWEVGLTRAQSPAMMRSKGIPQP